MTSVAYDAAAIPRSRSDVPRLQSLDVVRVAAACLIVLYHVHTILMAVTGKVPFGGIFRSGSSRGVDLFFVLNGFTLPYFYGRDVGRPERWGSYIFRRLSRIYPGVWIMTALALCIYLSGFGGAEKAGKLNLDSVISSLLLLPQEGTPLVNVTWTLKYVAFYYAVFGLAILNRRVGVAALAIWQAAIIAHVCLGVASASWDRFYLQPMGLEFGIGIACALLVRRFSRAILPLPALGPALALGLGVAGFGGLKILESYATGGLASVPAALLFGLCSGLVIVGASLLELGRQTAFPRPLVLLAAATFSIYLVNFSVITLAIHGLILIGVSPTNPLTTFGLAALGLTAGLAFHTFIDRPIQKRLEGSLSTLRPVAATLGHYARWFAGLQPQGYDLTAVGRSSAFALPGNDIAGKPPAMPRRGVERRRQARPSVLHREDA